MYNKYNITNMPSLIRRKDFFKVAQNPSNYPSLGTLDDRAKAPQQATPTSGGGRGGYPSFDALDPRRPQASPPAQQQQQASAQTQLDLNVSPNDPKAVQKMQAVIIDFGNVVSTNAVKAGKFLVDYVKSDQTQKGSSREKLDNVVKGMSAIGAAGKESTPDNIWMGKTDTALENISKFGLALKNFFSAEQNISVPQTILSSIDELSNLIKTKYTQLSQAEKNSRAARIITIITNIKALFNYLENVPQDPVSPQDSLQQVSGPSQDSSSILVFYDKIPQVIDLNQIAPSASDSIVITSNVLQTPELLTKYLQQYGVKVKGKDGQDLDINKDNIYAVAYFLKMRASTSQSRFKDKYAKQAEDLFQTTAPNKLKTYTNEQILTKLAQLGAPLNTNNVNKLPEPKNKGGDDEEDNEGDHEFFTD